MGKKENMNQLGIFDPPPEPPKVVVRKSGDPDGLRYYQREAFDAAMRTLADSRATLVDMATGMGKTQFFSAIIKHWPGRVLVLAHRDELVDQAAKRIQQMTGEPVCIEQAVFRAGKSRIVVGSVQSVCRPDRLERLRKIGGFSLIVADEAHHYISESYRRPLDYFSEAKLLGVTATPDRGDGRAIMQVFEDVCFRMTILDGIRSGYLVPPKAVTVQVEGVDLDLVGVSSGDLQAGDLDRQMLEHVEGVCQGMLQHCGDRQGVLFMPGVASAHAAAERLSALREGCARAIDGKTDRSVRRSTIADFKAGRFQILVNCAVATEGFDAPTASVVGIARPTKSRSLYTQIVGRVTRVLPGVVDHLEGRERAAERRAAIAASAKPDFLVVDFTGTNTKHDLVGPVDALGVELEAPVKERAKRMIEDGEGEELTLEELIEEAGKRLEAEALKTIARKMKGKARLKSKEYDLFGTYNVDIEADRYTSLEFGYKPPSEAQLSALEKFGWTPKELEGISRRAASRLMDECIRRKNAGLCSKKALVRLSKHGITDTDITHENATRAMQYLAKHSWGARPTFNVFTLHEIAKGMHT